MSNIVMAQNVPNIKVTKVASINRSQIDRESVERDEVSVRSIGSRSFSADRKCTDVFFLVLNVVFFVVALGLMTHCFANGDFNRSFYGYDDCGNICGKLNPKFDIEMCLNNTYDKRNESFLLVQTIDGGSTRRQCVSKCEDTKGFRTVGSQCVQTSSMEIKSLFRDGSKFSNFFLDLTTDLASCWGEFVLITLIAWTFSGFIVLALRYFADVVIWFILMSTIIAGFALSCFMAAKLGSCRDTLRIVYGSGMVIAMLMTGFFILLIFAVRKKIKLVIELFKEAGKAIGDVPTLLAQPFLTFITVLLTTLLFAYFVIVIESAGKPGMESFVNADTKNRVTQVGFEKDTTILVTRFFNIFAFVWFLSFVFSCQDFVVAGAVSQWFFSRTKSNLKSPLFTSFLHLIRYHLGSVSFGSLIMATIRMFTLAAAETSDGSKSPMAYLSHCLLSCIEDILKALTKNAYIIIAMDGTSFYTSGRRAVQLISRNFLGVIAIQSIGDFVLVLARIFIICLSILVGVWLIETKPGLHYTFLPIMFCAVISLLISQCFFSVYEMTIDTIFLCFCEDCEMNDGFTRPYYMSRSLMQLVQSSKKILKHDPPVDMNDTKPVV